MLQKLVITDKSSDYVKADFTIDDYQFITENLQFLVNYTHAEILFAVRFLAR